MANNIEDYEVNEISNMLSSSQQLPKLDHSWNKIGDTGSSAIANSINYLTIANVRYFLESNWIFWYSYDSQYNQLFDSITKIGL